MDWQEYAQLTDRELVLRYQLEGADAERAFEALYRRHSAWMARAPYLVSLVPADAQDALCCAWVRIHGELPGLRWRSEEAFRSWLHNILRRTCLDIRRAAVRRAQREVCCAELGFDPDLDAWQPPLDEVDREQRQASIELAHWCMETGKLSRKQYELVKLTLQGQVPPPSWTRAAQYVDWHRTLRVLVQAWRELETRQH